MRLLCFQEINSVYKHGHSLTHEGKPKPSLLTTSSSGRKGCDVGCCTNRVLENTQWVSRKRNRQARRKWIFCGGKNKVGHSFFSPLEFLFSIFSDLYGKTNPTARPFTLERPHWAADSSGLRENGVNSSGKFCSSPLRKMRARHQRLWGLKI